MQLPIPIEPTPDGCFRANLADPFHATAEADDAPRAVQELVRLLEIRLQSETRIAALTVANGAVQGTASPFPTDDACKTDWVCRELAEAVAENRRLEEPPGP